MAGAAKLAAIKAQLREIWLDGALSLPQSPHGIATRFRHLVCCACLRVVRVRAVLFREGIPVDREVLREILREERGMFPSESDEEVARQAIADAQVMPCPLGALSESPDAAMTRTLTCISPCPADCAGQPGEGEGARDPGKDGAEPPPAGSAPRVAAARERAQ